MILRVAPAEHYGWIVRRATVACTEHFRALEIVNDQGLVVGMVGFDNWTKSTAEIFVAIDSPLVARFLPGVLKFAFEHCGLIGLRSVVSEDNPKALRFNKHVGFREVYRMKDGWDRGQDLIFLELRPEWCQKWLSGRKVRNGREEQQQVVSGQIQSECRDATVRDEANGRRGDGVRTKPLSAVPVRPVDEGTASPA